HDERRPLDLLDDVGHRESLPGASDPEQGLVLEPALDPCRELLDCQRLIARGLEVRDQIKVVSHGDCESNVLCNLLIPRSPFACKSRQHNLLCRHSPAECGSRRFSPPVQRYEANAPSLAWRGTQTASVALRAVSAHNPGRHSLMTAFHIWTIGCQMNVADSRRLAESLEKYGLEAAQGPHDADVGVLYSSV